MQQRLECAFKVHVNTGSGPKLDNEETHLLKGLKDYRTREQSPVLTLLLSSVPVRKFKTFCQLSLEEPEPKYKYISGMGCSGN